MCITLERWEGGRDAAPTSSASKSWKKPASEGLPSSTLLHVMTPRTCASSTAGPAAVEWEDSEPESPAFESPLSASSSLSSSLPLLQIRLPRRPAPHDTVTRTHDGNAQSRTEVAGASSRIVGSLICCSNNIGFITALDASASPPIASANVSSATYSTVFELCTWRGQKEAGNFGKHNFRSCPARSKRGLSLAETWTNIYQVSLFTQRPPLQWPALNLDSTSCGLNRRIRSVTIISVVCLHGIWRISEHGNAATVRAEWLCGLAPCARWLYVGRSH